RVAAELTHQAPRFTVVSGLTGRPADPDDLTDPEYWVRHVRHAVRFADAVGALPGLGVTRCLELGADGTLTALAAHSLPAPDEVLAVPAQTPGTPGALAFETALAALYTRGAPVDWARHLTTPAPAAPATPLPTYAFQRRRAWLPATATGPAGLRAAGLGAARHPLLSATVELAAGGGILLTGRLSARTHGGLADQETAGVTLLPASVLVDLAVRAGDEAGCTTLEELTLDAPLPLPARGAVRMQIHVTAADPDGRRTVTVHSRPDDDSTAQPWRRHAEGVLTALPAAERGGLPATTPPEGAEAVDTDTLYERLAARGHTYGPAHRGVRALWRHDGDLYADLVVPDGRAEDTDRHPVHPALLEAALQVALSAAPPAPDGHVTLAGRWRGLTVHTTGARGARLRVTGAGTGHAALTLTGPDGQPLATVDGVDLTPLPVTALDSGRAADGLYVLEWTPVPAAGATDGTWAVLGADPDGLADRLAADGATVGAHPDLAALRAALDEGATAPATVLLTVDADAPADAPDAVVATAQDTTARLLATLQEWLAEDRLDAARLVVLTRGAVAALPGDRVPALAHAPLWGLVRTAQSEHPGRFALVDRDTATGDPGAVLSAAAHGDEPQLAVRAGTLLAPRAQVARTDAAEAPTDADADASTDADAVDAPGAAFGPDGTVLVTGGTGGLGGLLARHLVTAHGVRRLLLVSRSGPDAPGADRLRADLTALGAEVTVRACDVADPTALAALLTGIPEDRPLRGVVHTAGTLDDGLLTSLTPDRLAGVLRAKVTAAAHLHALTRTLPLTAFVTFSSAAGLLGNPGQANYAAANTFLDALTQHRRAAGLPGTSIAWGPWESTAGMTAGLDAAHTARTAAQGVTPLGADHGLALFDAAVTAPEALLLALRLDLSALRSRAATGELPSPLRGLVRATVRRGAAGPDGGGPDGGFARRVAALPRARRRAAVTGLVTGQVAALLGYDTADQVGAEKPFKELGFDSLAAVTLRNRLSQETGLRLPPTLVYDHPTPAALVRHLTAELGLDADGPAPDPAGTPTPTPVAADDDPVVIVGMGCRYPGGVDSPEALWQLVSTGGEGLGPFPADRGWDLDALYDPDSDRPGTTYVRRAGFLYDAGEFDAELFGLAPREALAMDPQQRLLLETSWEVFERAGIAPTALRGSRTGVFTGVTYHDYASGMQQGTAGNVAAGRVSYAFGLEGPCVAVDTACSSSLVALHLAAQALRAGECDLALAGGVAVMSRPDPWVAFSRERTLAADGRCKPFAADADGTNWAEGVGLLLLERLSDARRRGHPVLARIAASGVNQDGASNGLTAPSGPAQRRLIRQVLAAAALAPADVDAVEAHGTGTPLGDPIEAQALLATYGQDREQPLWLGSMKSNIGHTQAASGVGGVIKMVMAMRHGVLPRTLYADPPTPHVDWSAGAVSPLLADVPWPAGDRPRRAGVSAFGISGTNAHVIVEEAPRDAADTVPQPGDCVPRTGGVPLALSARGPEALRGQAARLHAFLTERPDVRLADVAVSLATARSALEHRAVVGAPDRAAALTALAALADGTPDPAGTTARGVAHTAPSVVLAFPPADPAWTAALAPLAATAPVFSDALEACGRALAGLVDWTPADVLAGRAEPDWRTRPEITVPLGWAVAVAAAELLRSWGVEPAAVTGRGTGEIAAARVAGLLDAGTAARLAVHFGRTPDGDLPPVVPGEAALPFRSAASGRWLETRDDADAWAAALTAGPGAAPADGPDPLTLPDGGRPALVTVGPAPAPGLVTGDEPPSEEGLFADAADLTPLLGRLHVRGVPVDWAAVLSPTGARPVPLPTYAFHRRHYWLTADPVAPAAPGTDGKRPPLLDSVVELPDSGGLLLTGTLSPATAAAYGTDPRSGAVPGTVLLELALLAGDHVGCDLVADLTTETPLALPEAEEVRLRVTVGEPDDAGDRPLRVHSRPAGALPGTPWTRHAHAALRPAAAPPAFDLDVWPPADAEPADIPGLDGLTGLWRCGDDLYAEVALPTEERTVGLGHALHPALLGTALRALARTAPETPGEPDTWQEAALYAAGATALRVRLTRTGPDTVALAAADDDGLPVASVAEVRLRPADPARLHAAHTAAQGPLLRVEWPSVDCEAPGGRPHWALVGPDPLGTRAALMKAGVYTEAYDTLEALAKAVDAGTAPPTTVLSAVPTGPADPAGAAVPGVDAVGHATALVARWLSDERFAAARLVLLTQGSLTGTEDTAAPDPVAAAVWGAVRSAQSADPGRLVLADLDGRRPSWRALPAALATSEPQLAVVRGTVRVPRLAPAPVPADPAPPVGPGGTVLVTGAHHPAAAAVARHLVTRHGAARLLLAAPPAGTAGATGAAGETVSRLAADLTALGADVTATTCDPGDRQALAELLTGAHPVSAVVHAAVAPRPGPDAAEDALAAELRAALALTAAVEPARPLYLLSDAAGTVGDTGHGAAAALAAFLDALAHHRPATTTIAFGPWRPGPAGTGDDATAVHRPAGLALLPPTAALGLFDAARALAAPTALLLRPDGPALAGRAQDPGLPAPLRSLTGPPVRRRAGQRGGAGALRTLRRRLAGLGDAERDAVLTELVRTDVAAVLQYPAPDDVDTTRAFRDIGLNSLTAFALRNRLRETTGLRLPAALLFEVDTPERLAVHLKEELLRP
ncbi:type I polyketide synthase, partial [Streptomyces heilongjiangensis]|uniref:type I polyketide synthase n=1 Tax=Streptomyces heilongjiangensis TaxID=945052 RepID=UPI00232E0B90